MLSFDTSRSTLHPLMNSFTLTSDGLFTKQLDTCDTKSNLKDSFSCEFVLLDTRYLGIRFHGW